jgi:lipoate-protein ligase B
MQKISAPVSVTHPASRIPHPVARPAPGLLVRLGRVEYEAAWELQRALARRRAEGRLPDLLLLVEHPPVFTVGRGGSEANLLASPAELAAMGACFLHVDRGGDITYHGPGQLVGYPIVDLRPRDRDVHRYLRMLEEALIRALTELDIAAGRLPPHTGVWVGEEKVAAIGVRISRGVTLHGFALNIDPDLGHFRAIIPCGIRDKGVTSVARLLGRPVEAGTVAARVAAHLGELLGLTWREIDVSAQPVALVETAITAAAD